MLTSPHANAGASALVFKCRWASRFGPTGLLAIKMLRDPHGYDAHLMVDAFKYEADVLSRCRCGTPCSSSWPAVVSCHQSWPLRHTLCA